MNLNKQGGFAWAGLHLLTRKFTFRFHNLLGISWLSQEELASQQGICCMDLGTQQTLCSMPHYDSEYFSKLKILLIMVPPISTATRRSIQYHHSVVRYIGMAVWTLALLLQLMNAPTCELSVDEFGQAPWCGARLDVNLIQRVRPNVLFTIKFVFIGDINATRHPTPFHLRVQWVSDLR